MEIIGVIFMKVISIESLPEGVTIIVILYTNNSVCLNPLIKPVVVTKAPTGPEHKHSSIPI
jgi:zinc transporter ZupT